MPVPLSNERWPETPLAIDARLKAVVKNARLVLDEPTKLSEGPRSSWSDTDERAWLLDPRAETPWQNFATRNGSGRIRPDEDGLELTGRDD
ncbi:MAG TPA: hypothetical protein VGG74_16165 [Kofleriaceae bacterium]|jgi:hypothetical protein